MAFLNSPQAIIPYIAAPTAVSSWCAGIFIFSLSFSSKILTSALFFRIPSSEPTIPFLRTRVCSLLCSHKSGIPISSDCLIFLSIFQTIYYLPCFWRLAVNECPSLGFLNQKLFNDLQKEQKTLYNCAFISHGTLYIKSPIFSCLIPLLHVLVFLQKVSGYRGPTVAHTSSVCERITALLGFPE